MDKRFLSTGAVLSLSPPPPQRPIVPGAPLHHVSPQMDKKARSQHLTGVPVQSVSQSVWKAVVKTRRRVITVVSP